MEYGDSITKAEQYAQDAFAKMQELDIRADPNNFAIWYHYYSGKFPDLVRTLDVLIENGQEFDDERNAELFAKFFTFDVDGSNIHLVTERLEAELASVLAQVGQAGVGATAYGETLELVSGQMDKKPDERVLGALVSSVLTATQTMQRQNQALESRLNESTSEISKLKVDLEDMRREAMTDALTGIANRKVFDSTLRREAMGAMETGEPLCLLMVDIDHFKNFNDSHGHQVGDQVLKLLAMTLVSGIKGQDTAARYGGEEFGVVLPRTGLDDGVKVADQIRKQVASRKVVNKTSGVDMGQITVSIGVGTYEMGEPLAQLIQRADASLYEAKRLGRNRVVGENTLEQKELRFEGA